jgi:hypothetical protein
VVAIAQAVPEFNNPTAETAALRESGARLDKTVERLLNGRLHRELMTGSRLVFSIAGIDEGVQ